MHEEKALNQWLRSAYRRLLHQHLSCSLRAPLPPSIGRQSPVPTESGGPAVESQLLRLDLIDLEHFAYGSAFQRLDRGHVILQERRISDCTALLDVKSFVE